MASININRNVLDPFYRYKMPRLQAKVEGKGNGIKTVIANMSEIAKALERPPTYPTKYFGCELGAQTNFDLKNERYIVNGEHDANRLQDILDGFIRKFVLCTACDNPETTLFVRKGQINQVCKACGHISIIDPKHKLSTFILKNPPKLDPEVAAKRPAAENGGGSPAEENVDGLGEIVVNENGIMRANSEDDDDDWAPEPDENIHHTIVTGEMAKLTMNKDLEKSVEERLDMLHSFFIAAKQNGDIANSKAMLNEAERLELKAKATLLLCDVIFNEGVVHQIKQHRNLLLRFTINDPKAERHLLGGIEQLISRNKDVLLAKTPVILKALYDFDIVSEDALKQWSKKPTSKYVKKELAKEIIAKAGPLLTWLEEAEEESDDDEDKDADVVKFDDRIHHGTMRGVTDTTGAKIAVDETDGKIGNIEIDDI